MGQPINPSLKRRIKDESGVAMVVALGALVVMLMLSAVVVTAAVNESAISNHDAKAKRAFEAAESGLVQTTYRMNMLINSSHLLPAVLKSYCVGSTVSATGTVSDPTVEVLEPPATFYASIDCGPHTESLGNGAFFTSWTSVVLSSGASCAGSTVGNGSLVTDRCITSQGIVCPPTYTAPSQLPCPNEVVHRVQERVAAATGNTVFPISGVIGLNGVLIENSAQIFGNVSTNLQLTLQQSAQVNSPATLAPSAPNPLIQNSAKLGTGLVCNSTTAALNLWSSACITRATTAFTLVNNPPPYPEYTDDYRIANGLSSCALANTCPHDVFSNSSGPCISGSGCASWNSATRTLAIPNGVTWTISGGAYNLCQFNMSGNGSAVLANGVKTAIYIDSPSNPSPSPVSGSCPAGTGGMSVVNQAGFVNNSPPLPGSPLLHDTTALQLWFFGPSDVPNPTWNNNACTNGNDPTCVSLGQGTDFYGTLYAPTSDVKIGNTANTYGGVAGRTVTYNNPGVFTQDANVPSLVTTATLGIYFRTGWTECASQPTSAANPRSGC